MESAYKSQSARDACAMGYGNISYWAYLDDHAQSQHDYWAKKGDMERAKRAFTDSLSDVLRGNEGI